jgi:hypothetical protein
MIHGPSKDLLNNWICVRVNAQKIRGPDHQGINHEFANWIHDNIDHNNWTWETGNDFYFRNEDDATLVKLRWL